MKTLNFPGIIVAALVASILLPVSAEVVVVMEEEGFYTPLNDTEVLVGRRDGTISIFDLDSLRITSEWEHDWDPAEWGWYIRTPFLWYLVSSPDREWICFGQFVRIPEELLDPDESYAGPMAVVLVRSDGTDARIVALSQEVGGGPDLDFTMDSRYLYGQPFYPCEPTAEAYLEYMRMPSEEKRELQRFSSIDLTDGSTFGNKGPLSDGYESNPWSDLVAGGCNPPNAIILMPEVEVLLDLGLNSDIGIGEWVLPDVALAWKNGKQGLLYPDGSFLPSPRDREIRVYTRLPSGAHLFSVEGMDGVLFGEIDWENFTSRETAHLPELDERRSWWSSIMPAPCGQGIFFVDRQQGQTCYFPIPERSVRIPD